MNITNIVLKQRPFELEKNTTEIVLTFEIDGQPYDYHALAPVEDKAYQEVMARSLLHEMGNQAFVQWKKRDAAAKETP